MPEQSPGLTHEENAEVERVLKEYAEAQRQLEKAHQVQLAAVERVGVARARLEEFGKVLLFRSIRQRADAALAADPQPAEAGGEEDLVVHPQPLSRYTVQAQVTYVRGRPKIYYDPLPEDEEPSRG